MLDACQRISEYVAGLDATLLKDDRKTVDAVVRNLEVLGEIAKRVPEETRALAPDIPWRAIAGFRDVLIHDYFNVDLDIVADAALVKVPELSEPLERLLKELDSTE